MTLPSKAPGYGYPRDVQSEVWKKWFDIRNEKNVILKMNTGSGKTVVGLIMLQSCLNEEKGPAIYVVPDNYLVKQVIDEAKRLGISATEDKDDYSYSNSKAILVTSIQTIVNGYSYFGMREGGNYPIGSIIIDDVHACMDKIISQFMIKIDAESDAYKELIAIFSSSLKDYNPKNYIDIVEMKDCRKKMLVPYWEWQRQQDNIYRILTKYDNSKNSAIYFGLPLIERSLETCDCIITASAIEISPKGIDLDKISSLEEASRRIYMSATLADDSVFVSALGLNTEDMKNKEPDIILRTAHALPDQVMEMFNEDFATNDIWKHFSAVKNNRVYDLTYEYYGMSANFSYPDALQELQEILYPDEKNSDETSDKKKKDSDKVTDKNQKNNDKVTDKNQKENDKTTDKKQED